MQGHHGGLFDAMHLSRRQRHAHGFRQHAPVVGTARGGFQQRHRAVGADDQRARGGCQPDLLARLQGETMVGFGDMHDGDSSLMRDAHSLRTPWQAKQAHAAGFCSATGFEPRLCYGE
ncbi:hypothetical protein CAL15_10010 [Bordetella genomosp. 13]|uniref:Uncharacterized protein n=1 Tax=Bordetella genomosp. 13 TaxID=463040 RepID=A0A1W6ZBF8_9BORD|nr:hypothetical protein CAL15_10010 [Bordetella genomosp. 13]